MKNPQTYCTFLNKDAIFLLLSLGCLQCLLLAEMCEFSSSLGSHRDFEDEERRSLGLECHKQDT